MNRQTYADTIKLALVCIGCGEVGEDIVYCNRRCASCYNAIIFLYDLNKYSMNSKQWCCTSL